MATLPSITETSAVEHQRTAAELLAKPTTPQPRQHRRSSLQFTTDEEALSLDPSNFGDIIHQASLTMQQDRDRLSEYRLSSTDETGLDDEDDIPKFSRYHGQ